jgi:hypothetical protein
MSRPSQVAGWLELDADGDCADEDACGAWAALAEQAVATAATKGMSTRLRTTSV